MKKLLFTVLLASIAFTAPYAQKTINDLHAQKREVSSFHSIEVSTGILLVLTEGEKEEVAVSASSEEFRDKIVSRVENGVLKLYYENKVGSVNKQKEIKDLKAYVSYKSIKSLNVNTGAEVQVDGTLNGNDLKISANTGAIISGKIKVAVLKVDQNTGSKITLSGTAVKMEVSGDTGSKFTGSELETEVCNASVRTGAIISVNAQKELIAKANTGGNIRYKGEAAVKNIKKNTGGSVTKI